MSETKQMHISLNVANLQASVEFFGRLFGAYPAKFFPDYAKFEIANPPLVLSLEPKHSPTQESLNHLGLRVADQEKVQEQFTLLAQRGIETQVMNGVQCCYSEQTKIALNDPDGNLWEVYTLDKDLEPTKEAHAASMAKAASTTEPPTSTFEHLLGSPLSVPFAADDTSVDRINLKGTFNTATQYEKHTAILGEAQRILKPGGSISLHLLVADRLPTKALPKLPGPASLVDFTPAGEDIVAALENAGFVGIRCKRYSHAPVYRFDGCEMRELLIEGNKAPATQLGIETVEVIYKGPYPQVSDDLGQEYKRGLPMKIAAQNAETLKLQAFADDFVFVTRDQINTCDRS